MALSFFDFLSIGKEEAYLPQPWPVRLFTGLLGPIGLHPRIRNAHIIKAIQQAQLPDNAHILDAGSGRGLTLLWLAHRYPHFSLSGIELEEALVLGCRRITAKLGLPNVRFDQGDLTRYPFEGPYDLIFSIDVLEHIEDDLGVLRKIYQALAPGGKLLLHLPLRHQDQRRIFPIFKEHTVDDHVRDEYTPAEIQAKLEATGFTVCQLTYGFGLFGALAFELNTLFWNQRALRAVFALLTYPLALPLAFLDVRRQHTKGNSLIIVATRSNS